MNEILSINNLSVSYPEKEILHDVNLHIAKGETIGLTGESGSGKTTLLKAIMGLLPADAKITHGQILFVASHEKFNLVNLDEKSFRLVRGKHIGMIFQDPSASLCPVRTIGSQMIESGRAHARISKKEVFQETLDLFKQFGLEDDKRVWKSYPFEMSGGMNQRIAIIMAMLNKPEILLADEPTSSLDGIAAKRVIDALRLVNQIYGTSIIFVSHNIQAAKNLCDRLYTFENGTVLEQERDANGRTLESRASL